MTNEMYHLKFYLYANKLNTLSSGGVKSSPFTWELNLFIVSTIDAPLIFANINDVVDAILNRYQNKLLDEEPQFKGDNIDIKRVLSCLRKELDESLSKVNALVIVYELNENPLNSYIIDTINNQEYYKYKFFLDASHSITLNNQVGVEHNHCFEIDCVIIDKMKDFLKYDVLKEKLDNFFQSYSKQYLNILPEFKRREPTLENLTTFFKYKTEPILETYKCELSSIEIHENSSVGYIRG